MRPNQLLRKIAAYTRASYDTFLRSIIIVVCDDRRIRVKGTTKASNYRTDRFLPFPSARYRYCVSLTQPRRENTHYASEGNWRAIVQ